MLTLAITALLAYLLGSVLGSLVVGRLKGGVDIRKQGSGNAGGTNALRTQGWQFALWVMIIDIGKGWVAVALLPMLPLPGAPLTFESYWVPIACAAAVVLGHVYPIWFGFRGGKGAATLVGVILGLAPPALPYVLCVWLVVLALTGYVGLSTMLATASFNAWVVLSGAPLRQPLLWFGIAITAFVAYTHRSNIARMLSGTENRAQRVWLFKKRA